jgi:hypothetical protein
MKIRHLLFLLFICMGSRIFAQDACKTITIKADVNGSDAEVWSLQPTTSQGPWPEIKANSWTWGGVPGNQRGLFKFKLAFIPSDATIISADLTLFPDDSPSTEFDAGANAATIYRISKSWNSQTVTWNNQPPYTTVDAVSLPASTKGYEVYRNIDVTQLVKDILTDGKNNGFILKLNDETDLYNRLTFGSSNNPDHTRFPKLQICYSVPAIVETDALAKNAELQIFPNPSQGMFTINFPAEYGNSVSNIKVFDFTGKLINQQSVNSSDQFSLDLSSSAPGIYMLLVQNNNKVITKSIVKE